MHDDYTWVYVSYNVKKKKKIDICNDVLGKLTLLKREKILQTQKALIYITCQSLWYKYSYYGQFQATDELSLNTQLGSDANNLLSVARVSQLHHAPNQYILII